MVCFRLNLPVFAFSNLISLYLYSKSHNLLFASILKIIALPMIFALFHLFVKRYNYFFFNQGWSFIKMYTVIALVDFGVFLSFIALGTL